VIDMGNKQDKPKILLFDLETFPLEVYAWRLFDITVGLGMVKEESSILSWCGKWYGEDEIFYEDVQGQKNLRDDKKVIKKLWKLLDEADIVVGHNSERFDVKVINARFKINGMKPPSSYRRMDTLKMAKRNFSFMSNKLEYLTGRLCSSKKLLHNDFPGFALWAECLKGNPKAFKTLKEYNIMDVTSLEELFNELLPWDNSKLFSVYTDDETPECSCGNQKFQKAGYYYTNSSKFQKYKCTGCGSEFRDSTNLLSKTKRASIRKGTVR